MAYWRHQSAAWQLPPAHEESPTIPSAALGSVPPTPPTRAAPAFAPLAAVLAALLLGTVVRLSHLLPADFPLNDGGLFYVMVGDLQRASYLLPDETSYNHAGIPFVYPPLAFYLAGLLDDFGPWSLLDLFRALPLLLSVLTIAAFFPLARALLPSPAAANWAVGAFALLPMGFHWLIMGGGLTRALGFLFAILALRQVHALYVERGPGPVWLATLFAAATVLSHPAMAWFVAYSSACFFVAFGRSRIALVRSLLVGAGVVLLTAPWWGTMLLRHGAVPVLTSGGSALSVFGPLQLLTLTITNEPFFPVLAALALVGALACLRQRRYWLPTWLALMVLLDARSPLASASVPLALLAGIGTAETVLPWLTAGSGQATPLSAGPAPPVPAQSRGRRTRLAASVIAIAIFITMLNGVVDEHAVLVGLTGEQQAAMRWVAEHTPPESTFLVLTGSQYPTRDRIAEWFPALSGRASVTTAQGYEWLAGGAFQRRVGQYPTIQPCALRDVRCVEVWARDSGVRFSHVFLPTGPTGKSTAPVLAEDCCWSIRASLRADPRYELLHDGPGATVFRAPAP